MVVKPTHSVLSHPKMLVNVRPLKKQEVNEFSKSKSVDSKKHCHKISSEQAQSYKGGKQNIFAPYLLPDSLHFYTQTFVWSTFWLSLAVNK